MKKITTILMLLLLLANVHGKARSGSSEKEKKGRYKDTTIIKTTQKWLEAVYWENYERTIFTYDASGNLAEELSQVYDASGWLNNIRSTYSYNARGNKIAGLRQDWMNSKWENHFSSVIVVDEKGDRLKEDVRSWNGSTWTGKSESVYTRDDKGKLLVLAKRSRMDTAWTNSRYTFTYDESGNEATRLVEELNGSRWEKLFRDTYANDEKGNHTSWIIQEWKEDQWMNAERHSYTYNEMGKLASELHGLWKENSWADDNLLKYAYDKNGNMSTCLSENQMNKEEGGTFSWIYDDKGNELEEAFRVKRGDELENYTRTLSVYYYRKPTDALLKDTTVVLTCKILNGNTWENQERYSTSHDACGRVIRNLTEHWNNDAWEFNNEFTYVFLPDGKVESETYKNTNDYITQTAYVYNADGKLASSLTRSWTGSYWNNLNQALYYYTDKEHEGHRLQTWIENEWKDEGLYEQVYDKNRNLLVNLTKTGAYPNWENNKRTISAGNENGKETMRTSQVWDGKTWKDETRYSTTYNKKGNAVNMLYENFRNDVWEISSRYTYTCDKKGNVILEIREDWLDKKWKNYSKDEYTYDAKENQLSHKQYSWLSSGKWDLWNECR
ncbi:MAG: hypothetical protein ACJ76F_10120 [Bacteroidia bacterium]